MELGDSYQSLTEVVSHLEDIDRPQPDYLSGLVEHLRKRVFASSKYSISYLTPDVEQQVVETVHPHSFSKVPLAGLDTSLLLQRLNPSNTPTNHSAPSIDIAAVAGTQIALVAPEREEPGQYCYSWNSTWGSMRVSTHIEVAYFRFVPNK